MKKEEAPIVYSRDPTLNKKCQKCKEVLSECRCTPEEDASNFQAEVVLRIEKQGRVGKTVTIIERLPKNSAYLQNLTTLLKKKCGAGGTFSLEGKTGVIEIQGDKRESVRATLIKENIRIKN